MRSETSSLMSAGAASANEWGGVVEMTNARYRRFADLADTWLLDYRPGPESLRQSQIWRKLRGDEPKAVYIVVNSRGKCCYVGQTRPSLRGENVASVRLNQHLCDPSKREHWAEYWVIPLRGDTPNAFVNELERRIALRLMVPLRHYRSRELRR